MGIKGLDHVNINTSNMKDTMSFYTDLLDFTDGFRPPFDFPGAWLYAGGMQSFTWCSVIVNRM